MELKTKNTDAFDIIVSTVPIPYENIDCVTVSPLLDTEDVKQIKHQLTRKIPLILRKSGWRPKPEPFPDMLQIARKIGHYAAGIQHILSHFTVETMEAESSLEHTVKRICGTLEDQGLVKDAGQMADGLMKREAQGGLGIPGTTFALFHLKVKRPRFPSLKLMICPNRSRSKGWTEAP